MNKKRKKLIENLVWAFLAVLILIGLWTVASLAYGNPFILPKPGIVFEEALKLLLERVFWNSFFASLGRCLFALALSFIVSLMLSVFSVLYRPLYRVLAPVVTVLRSVPTMSIIFILLLVFSPKTAPVFVVFLVVMPSMYSMHISAFLGVPKELIETGRVFGFNKFKEVKEIYLPLTLPVLVESIAGGFSLSLKILVAAEVLSSTAQSIGYMLTLANLNIQIAKLLAVTLIAIVVCLIFELLMRLVGDRVSKDLY